MNGDFARVTFGPKQLFSCVLQQQGKVLLEADFNEQSAIHHYFLRTLIVDLIGRHWRAGGGFQIAVDPKNRMILRSRAGIFTSTASCATTMPTARTLRNPGHLYRTTNWRRRLTASSPTSSDGNAA